MRLQQLLQRLDQQQQRRQERYARPQADLDRQRSQRMQKQWWGKLGPREAKAFRAWAAEQQLQSSFA
eukprot:9408928-Alexandrium_andersonii.AAC.1